MSEEDLEVLITLDDPGEEDLEEDTFHLQSDKVTARGSGLNKVATRRANRSSS